MLNLFITFFNQLKATFMDVYMGLIFPSALSYAPTYTDNCYGQTYNISTNSALYSLLGTNFGGNGIQTFGIPDLRGRVPVGIGSGGANVNNIILGSAAGNTSISLTIGNLPTHNHPATFAATTGASPISITVGSGGSTTSLNAAVPAANINGALTVSTVNGSTNIPSSTNVPAQIPGIVVSTSVTRQVLAYGSATAPNTSTWPVGGTTAAQTAPVTGTISGSATMVNGGNVTIGNTGGGSPIPVMQPYIGISFLIITQGLYPPRP